MTSKLTRERIELIANFHRAMTLPPSHAEIEELARIALAAMDSEPVGEVIEVGDALLVEWHKNLEEGAKLYTTPQAPVIPFGLHLDTKKLVTEFCTALAEKLFKAQLKYGHSDNWSYANWEIECQTAFHEHIAKGDPRDVAAYCAFMWYHGWKTESAQPAPVVPDDVQRDAKRWRALLGSARIRILGSAGFDATAHPGENPDYRHFGMEIWTHYPNWLHEKNEYGIDTLTQYADAMLAAAPQEVK